MSSKTKNVSQMYIKYIYTNIWVIYAARVTLNAPDTHTDWHERHSDRTELAPEYPAHHCSSTHRTGTSGTQR